MTLLSRALLVPVVGCALMLGSSAAQTPSATPPALRVTLLGTGTPTPSEQRFGACTLVEAAEQRLLFDAGRGCVIRLNQVGVAWRDLTSVFLTHLHADHTFALPDVFLMGWILGRTDSLDLRGPAGTKDMFASMVHSLDVDIASRVVNSRKPPAYSATDIAPGVIYDRNGLKVTAFEVDHTVKPAFGYRVDFNGRSVVFSGDTRYSENLIRHARGADVLVHEVVFGAGQLNEQQQFVIAGHTTPSQAAQVFEATKPRLAIYSHVLLLGSASDEAVMATTRAGYSGRVEMGVDLTVIDVADTIATRQLK